MAACMIFGSRPILVEGGIDTNPKPSKKSRLSSPGKMRKTMFSDEPELLRLCRNKKWMAVSLRCQSHPSEAVPSDLALCRHGETALSMAVRTGAPRDTIQLLLEASFQQINVIHRIRGSVLLDALRHRASDEVLDYLLRAVIHQGQADENGGKASFHSDILSETDDLGRTALHCMVERVKQSLDQGVRNPSDWYIFRKMLLARPESVCVTDNDGNTPLILLLLFPRVAIAECCSGVEEDLFRMVKLMVTACPSAAAIQRTLPEPWNQPKIKSGLGHSDEQTLLDGVPTPLYYAISHGRSVNTVQALTEANRKKGINGCATRVNHYQEMPLHIAISTRASIPVISHICSECPQSTLCPDESGLSPVDWMWIRYVMDWHTSNTTRALVSRGRHISTRFLDWHEDISKTLLQGGYGDNKTKHLVERMRTMLPVAAAAATPGTSCQSWSVLHASCFVPCPLAMVHLAVQHADPKALWTPGVEHRLPLHWAVARYGYTANYPLGFSRDTRRLIESTAVPMLISRFPEGCKVLDVHGQLPLHIALDAARHYREASASTSMSRRLSACEVDAMEDEIITALIDVYPEALEYPDRKTGLLPFQQAAVGSASRLNTVYAILRTLPSLIGTKREAEVDAMEE